MPTAPQVAPTPNSKLPHPPKDTPRELVETIVFVVVLVLILKLFVVEAFVIPTGSMAETLFGYKKQAVCDQCGYKFPVNASCEVEPEEGRRTVRVTGYTCPNCFHRSLFQEETEPSVTSGDRVLVHKAMATDQRGYVVVFKYPSEPQKGQVAQNYIKRLMGFGGETIALYRGDLYTTRSIVHSPEALNGARELDLWQREYMFPNDSKAEELFWSDQKAGFVDPRGFQLYRKPDEILLEMRRIVYDNDFQAADLIAQKAPPRWNAEPGWSTDAQWSPKVFTHSGSDMQWLRYRHLLPVDPEKGSRVPGTEARPADLRTLDGPGPRKANTLLRPAMISNFVGYNNAIRESDANRKPDVVFDPRDFNFNRCPIYWCGDLILEAQAKVEDAAAEVVLELSKGPNRYQAVFAKGQVTLLRTGPGGKEMAKRATPITKPGTYQLRFANCDCRLRVWVNDEVIDFGGEADYAPPTLPEKFDVDDLYYEGWTKENDLAAPASIGAKGPITVSSLKVWRDTFHTPHNEGRESSNVSTHLETYYVQPGHYLCLGDNSTQSSDGRTWGTVPERLMLGRAVFVFFPLPRVGFIR